MNSTKIIQRLTTASILIALFLFVYILLPAWILSAGLIFICVIILLTEWPAIGAWWLAPLYPALPFALLITLNQAPSYHHLVLFIIALSGSFDMGAYITGTAFGAHKIAPRISPKKTWEGLCGGFLLTYAASFIVLTLYPAQFSKLLLALISGIAAFTGDLFASWLKRRAGIKDYGVILPGHGGLLDRFDSILFVSVSIYFLRNLLVS